ncbi:MAG: helix-turn-helix transcriptional regulator [Alphaproteobacteria bacterium]|nr:helix-turn-helix transcriptional regulator [Alphaproteobacteria bacterium]
MRQKNSKNGTIRGRLADGGANPIDLHVGKRLKKARLARGMSQERLAKAMNITFQQVQKYEKGLNRIGASRLWDLAQVLDVPITYFYEGMSAETQDQSPRKINVLKDSNGDFRIEDLVLTPEDIELIAYYKQIKNPMVIQNILNLVKSLAGEEPDNMSFLDMPDDMG